MEEEQILRIDGCGNVKYDMNWPYDVELREVVANGSLRNVVTDFLRVAVKPEACKGSVESELEKLAVSAALNAGSKMRADYVVLSENSTKEVEVITTCDIIHATYVATFYVHSR